MYYATISDVQRYAALTSTQVSSDSALIRSMLRSASMYIDRRRRCDVRRETRRYDYPVRRANPFGAYSAEWIVDQMNAATDIGAGLLRLDDDMLEIEQVINGDGQTISSSDYLLEPANLYPKNGVRLINSERWLTGDGGRREQVIQITGLWGYAPRYDMAWANSLDSVQNDDGIGASETTIDVTDVDGVAEDGLPRFEIGMLARIGNELLDVTNVNATENQLTVRRGANGSVASAHDHDAEIHLYRPDPQVNMACVRLATWRYRQKDANVFDKTVSINEGVVIVPSAVPADINALMPPVRRSIR